MRHCVLVAALGGVVSWMSLGCGGTQSVDDAATGQDAAVDATTMPDGSHDATPGDATTALDASDDASAGDASASTDAGADASTDAGADASSDSGSSDAGPMGCASGRYDLNGLPGDGCEFELGADAIYVSANDIAAVDEVGCGVGPVGTLAGAYPCRSIGFGLAEADRTLRTRVLVAAGLYAETVSLVNGVRVLGGHHPTTWERDVAANVSTVRPLPSAGHTRAVVAQDITLPTSFEGFTVHGVNATTSSANSYAIWIRDASSQLALRDNYIVAANGADGDPGAPGAEGSDGVDGQPGERAIQTASITNCQGASNVPGNQPLCFDAAGELSNASCGAGGVRTCGAVLVSGGAGAGAVCPTDNTAQGSGAMGSQALGGGAAGAGGDGGHDRVASQCVVFNTGGFSAHGSMGGAGTPGASVPGGAGGGSTSGPVAGEWRGAAGTGGGGGRHGGGGGGGGAGGGADLTLVCVAGAGDALGGSGGGGGSGGCGGTGGGGGQPGGGSFGVYIVFSVPSASLPVLMGNTILAGAGGDGGAGGTGGPGGEGSVGGSGGGVDGTWSAVLGLGGPGGPGGAGGHGGGGGGGAGGSSYGIYLHQHTQASGYGVGNTLFPSGSGGGGGAGGLSLGMSGTSGAPGVAVALHDELL
ncbi:MAG: hypothetical protein H6726_25440 [Sandaracinaceae bacterium]|nr:hypothetical protein [Sandaracinaceae bacterium]